MTNCFCCDPRRRNAVEARPDWNGIDFLEVLDDPADPIELRQTTLLVTCVHDLSPGTLTAANVRIDGGERIRNIRIVAVDVAPSLVPPGSAPGTSASVQPRMLRVRVAAPGDFSFYTLRLVDALDDTRPPAGFDRLLSSIDFTFKGACAGDFDCADGTTCPEPSATPPELNYLARDYATFRQLLLDRLALTTPGWQERSAADVGIVLTELLAYVADRIAYEQDAVATEAYLGTSRLRTSARRHARLVDYAMHDGCNARTFVQLVAAPGVNGLTVHRVHLGRPTQVLTRTGRDEIVFALDSVAHRAALAASPEVFELLHDVTLFEPHNTMHFYTWGSEQCCLAAGATAATLRGHLPDLRPGDVLVLAEARSPTTGRTADADTTRRHAVKLTRVALTDDPVGGAFAHPPHGNPVPVTEIAWHPADALPVALTLSSLAGTTRIEDVSVAYGNIVAADHGLTRPEEALPVVPTPDPVLARVRRETPAPCTTTHPASQAPRFRPRLSASPITQACAFDEAAPPAAARDYLAQRPADAVACATLREDGTSLTWHARRDLLSSASTDRDFVLEVEHDGRGHVRFGDDVFGQRPATGVRLLATYRSGNGTQGNVGESALRHLASTEPALTTGAPPVARIWNPLPARGGAEPESIESVRRRAPSAFRIQERCVTPADYEARARIVSPDVQRAGATPRWTGSWRTMFLTVDRFGAADVDEAFADGLLGALEPYRLAGQDLEVDSPHYVPLEIAMEVCVRTDHYRADVGAALRRVLSSRTLPDGTPGVFHPDRFSFGATVYLSPIEAAALATDGVDSVSVTAFRRQGQPATDGSAAGWLRFGRLEIPRLDNDPNFPDRGSLTLTMRGGR
ncbi:MAG: putative baseplate assembly protein [Betaproteobacteria bacterium]|nr:putative baseplate assembly protein [Betaproteobacteria bacterium]